MSRLELSAIQSKLKAAIQSHQMLVVKMKGDNQNAALKKGLTELQEEIKRLSEEQKKIVEKVRENLVKSGLQTQPQQPVTPIATLGQTITAIGQPRLVSFPTQGGATILPVGMVAVPIAHMQRPAVGMTIHPANTGPISQAASISIIPTGIISTGCNISLNPINSGATISLGSTVSGIIHGNIAINNLGNSNLVNTTAVTSASSGLAAADSTVNSCTSTATVGNGNVAPVVSGCIPSSSTALTSLTNVTNVIFSSSTSNGQNSTSNSASHVLPNNNTSSVNGSVIVPTTSTILPAAPASAYPVSNSGIVISQFPQQPLVQPQLLQQQQQQILQMIQQQQLQQQPQQRLASHMPIKVPQYTASVIRPAVSSTSVQFCNIAPAPSSVTTTSTTSSVRLVSSTSSSLPAKPTVNKETTAVKEQQQLPKQDVSKPQQQQQQQKQQQKQQQQQLEVQQEQQQPSQTPAKTMSPEELQKLEFMRVLDLYTLDALKEVMNRRSERKRRTTANPNYSFGFEFNRRDRNGSIWATISPKKPRTRGKGSAVSSRGNGWTNSASVNHQQSRTSKSIKSNDNHDDYCAACGKGGQLLMCETCRLVYHLDCLNPPLTEAPRYAWSCPKCLVSGKGFQHLNSEALAKVQSYIAKKVAKEEERKRVQRKSQEISTEKHVLENKNKELDVKMKEQKDLQTRLSAEEKKVKEELSKLSDFVHAMRESRTTDHLSGSRASAT